MLIENSYTVLESRWKSLRAVREISVREVACAGAPRTLLCAEIGDANAPCIALSAGVHGDEPAGVWALLELVERQLLDPRYAYRIWPCMNPTGFDAMTRTSVEGVDLNRTFGRGGQSPEARAIIMANRNRKFVLSIDLHEDCDANGFYVYEYGGSNVGTAALYALEAAGYAIEPLDELELGGPALEAVLRRERGRIVADPFEEAVVLESLSYSLLLARRAARYVLTFETPGRFDPALRIAMHVEATQAAISAIVK